MDLKGVWGENDQNTLHEFFLKKELLKFYIEKEKRFYNESCDSFSCPRNVLNKWQGLLYSKCNNNPKDNSNPLENIIPIKNLESMSYRIVSSQLF